MLCECLFITLAPGAPENFMAEAISSTAIMAMWMEPLDTNGILLNYELTIELQTGYLQPFNITLLLQPTQLFVEIGDLEPFALYYLRLRAQTSVGLGNETTTSVITDEDGMLTVEVVCGSPKFYVH